MKAGGTPLTSSPAIVKVVRLPAVALLVKNICPRLPVLSAAATKFCLIPELFVMPIPLITIVNDGLAVIVNALAPGLNTMPSTSVLAERVTLVVLEDTNVAVSDGPLGIV